MNILIIMPEDEMAAEFTAVLSEDPDVNLIATDSEDEGFKILSGGSASIDAVLEDLPFARKNDFSLIKKIDADPIFAAIPVIAIMETAPEESDMDCFDAGFSDIFFPPDKSRHLIKRINNAIKAKDSLSFSEIEKMLKELPSNIYLKDAEGKYVFATHYWHHLNNAEDPGWTIRGKTDYQIRKDKANAIKAMESDKRIIETGEGTSYIIEENDDGIREFLQLIKRPIFDKSGKVSGIVALINDVTEVELLKRELEERSKIDLLTHLLNKTATEDLIRIVLSGYRIKDKLSALLMIDLDKFKMVNDIFGHSIGDHVLAVTGRIIHETFKGMDVAGRVGGDEFMVLLRNIDEAENAISLADTLQKSVRHAFEGEEIEGYVSLSIGISIYPEHGKNFEELYHAADRALYYVKEHGRGANRLFDGTEKINRERKR